MENMTAGYDSAYEAEALRKDGSTFPCEIRGKTIKYGDREVRVTALRDLTRRKETEDALKKSRQNYKTLIEALTEAFGIQDENGLITYVNKKQLELLGYREEEMLGRPFIDFMDEKSREISKAEFGRRIQGVSGAYEINMVRKDGRVVNVIISAKPLFDDEGIFKGSFGVATDITARKKMEEALKESENRLTLALEGAALGLWDWNLKTGKAVWIDRNVTMLGYCSDEVKQDFKTWKSMVHPDDWPEVSKRLNDHIKGKTELFEAEYRIRNKAGNWQWTQSRGKTVELDENGDPVRMAGVVVDIDETKRTEMELEKTKALLLAAVEQSPAGILIADAPEVRIRLANSAALGIRGESEKSLTDIPLESHPGAWNTFHMSGNICEPEDLPLSRAILYGETVKNKELTIRRNDGESRTVLANASPVRDAEGNVVAGVVVFPDITDRKNAEKALLQSERRLRMALEHMPALLVAFDHNNHIVVANEACERVTGYSRDEIINNPQVWEALYSGENGTGASKGLEALDGDFINKELSLLGKDGEKKTISWSNISNEVPIPGWSSWAIGIDVTEMRLAENALKESETRYRTLFSYMREGVALHKILYNENGEPEDYMVTDVNFAFESITGISREKAIGAKGSELYGTGEAPFLEEYAQVADSGSFWKRDIYWRKMRKHFSVSAFSPGPGAFATVFTDITEQKEAEQNLSRTMAQLNGLLENMPDYVHFKDTQRRHVFVNRALEDFLGLPRERIIGARIEDFYQKGLNDDSSSTDQRIIEGEDLIRFEHESVNAKGELRLLDTVKFRILNDQGHFIGIGGLTRDVTDSKRLERQLLQSQKMEAIGTLAGGIAHDFNNLLQVIQGYADVASFKLDNERPLSNELSEIKKAAKTAAELTRGLLTFSRRLESKLKPVNLNRELENLVNMLKRTLPKSIEISFTPDEALGIVKADPAQMQQVIMNLAVNARDAMPEGGTLSIQTENTFLDEQYCKTNLDVEPGDYTLVTVSDTGLGMDRNTAKHIFDPFFTTKDLGQGTGLGLAIVYGIVKNHRGAILCYSEPDMGTTFRIYLPVVIEESETAPERDHRNLPGGDETILLVDDEEAILENGRVLLSNYGYEILTANNGRQALEIYRDRSKEISLIVLDLIMPEMDGKTCLEEILKINPLEKVIIASGYAANGIMDETMDLGAKASIKKPFESGKILELIRAVIDEGELPETTL
jgi:PAS domain S-box-containing protein